MMKKKKIELLAPAGDFQCLAAAVNAGADAVYFGLQDWNMRANAKNFKIKDLKKIKEITGRVKRYLTLNTIIYDNELKKVENIIKKSKPYIDAVICWDLSIINLCRKYKVPFHISTQASVSNTESARFYKRLGAKRIILARELDLKQIKKISKIIPIEVFIHGAMCVSVSGRCFTSQFLFNKSANRGECLHPCRRSYVIYDDEGNKLRLKDNKVMSAKDLCVLPFIEQLKKAGVTSFKIEGRNKEPEYIDAVVRVYRKALDNKLDDKDIKFGISELKKVYNKGFSSGFFLGMPTKNDFSKSEHSSSTHKKRFIGKIVHYFPKVGVAVVRIMAGKLEIGDDILIIGDSTGVVRHKIKRMEINHKPVKKVGKGRDVGIKIPDVRKSDEIYIIIKK
jgi:putative protease